NLFNMSTDYLEKDTINLSGGEKQRISLIRSLIFKPEVLLLDEVTSALDVDNTKIVENIINNLNEEGVTILWITHNPEQSRKYANKILTIENGSLKSLEVLR
ncbi:MAG: ATP-binding cassette domain-containing protein, partial [Clostridiaceae bacterium]|nr:ATP-binding cassette domain-containing protein [Clostridiaceae bacterium]